MMVYEYITCEIENKVAVVTIDRPPVNPLSSDVFQELKEVFEDLENNASVGAIVLTGAGEKAFVAGADIKEMINHDWIGINQMNKKSRAAFSAIENVKNR